MHGRSMPIKVNRTRYKGRTVFGIISNFADPLFMLGSSTNLKEYMVFLEKFRETVPHGMRPIFIYDGASAHTSKKATAYLNEFCTGW